MITGTGSLGIHWERGSFGSECLLTGGRGVFGGVIHKDWVIRWDVGTKGLNYWSVPEYFAFLIVAVIWKRGTASALSRVGGMGHRGDVC